MKVVLLVVLYCVSLQLVQSFLHSISEERCTQKFRRNHDHEIEKCQPRPTMMPILHLFPTDQIVSPTHVTLNQCGGGVCFGQMSCVSVGNTTIERKFMIFDYFGNKKCQTIKLYEHERCACKCTVMAHHCNAKQRYDQRACACICNNEHQKNECTNAMEWDSKQCQCVCPHREDCSTGLVWVPAFCRCVPFQLDDRNNEILSIQDN